MSRKRGPVEVHTVLCYIPDGYNKGEEEGSTMTGYVDLPLNHRR